MRRLIFSMVSVLTLLVLATPSHGFWIFQHKHGHGLHGYPMMAQPMVPAQPLSILGLLGGIAGAAGGGQIDVQRLIQEILQRVDRPQQQPIEIAPEVKKRINDTHVQINDGIDDLNKLTDRINKKMATLPKDVAVAEFRSLEKLTASASTGGTRKDSGGGPSLIKDKGP